MTDQEIIKAIRDAVTAQIDAARIGVSVEREVRASLEAEARKREDPFRTALQFLAGQITFCLALIIGVIGVFPVDEKFAATPAFRMMGGVLAWIAVTAILAAICIGAVQAMKRNHRMTLAAGAAPAVRTGPLTAVMYAPVVVAIGAVVYCVRGGAAMLANSTDLPPFLGALAALF